MDGESQVLVGLALLAAVLYGLRHAGNDAKGAAGAAVKTASTALLALVLALEARAGAGWFWLVPLGLGLGALGDLCLALKGQRAFLVGVGAFGLGHMAYAVGFFLRSRELGFDGISMAELLVIATLLTLLLSTEIWLAPRTGRLRGPVRAYVGLIGAMGLAAVALPAAPGQGTLRAGAALFLLSDLLLAFEMFVAQDARVRRGLALTLWPAYWAGQALIALGAVVFWGLGQG